MHSLYCRYFKHKLNIFDFSIVVLSLMEAFSNFGSGVVIAAMRIMRVFLKAYRSARMLTHIHAARTLRTVLSCTAKSVQEVAPVGGLLAILFFMYAVLGRVMFFNVRLGININEQANFRYFGSACTVLLRCITGDNWCSATAQPCLLSCIHTCEHACECVRACVCRDGMLEDLAAEKCDDPDPLLSHGCGGPWVSHTYMYSFLFFGGFMCLNLVVGIILEQLEASSEEEQPSPLKSDKFAILWAKFDLQGRRRILANELENFLIQLGPPLGFSAIAKIWPRMRAQKMRAMKIKLHTDGTVGYMDVFEQLALNACGFTDISQVLTLNRKMQILQAKIQRHKNLSRPTLILNLDLPNILGNLHIETGCELVVTSKD